MHILPISKDAHFYIDFPPDKADLGIYCASLGHKVGGAGTELSTVLYCTVLYCVQVNHSFLPNCKFGSMWHPRWGRVRTVVTTKELEQGQELLVTQYLQYLCNYNIYNIYRWTMVTTCCGVRSGTATSGQRRWAATTPASSTGTTEQQADHWAVIRIRYIGLNAHIYI